MPISVNFPFALSTGSLGYFEVTNDTLSAIAANVKCLLVTNWGERPMHATMGCNLREFVFEPKNDATRGRIADRIVSQVRQWLPFLVVDKLYLVYQEDDPSVPEDGFRIHLELLFGNRVVVVDQPIQP